MSIIPRARENVRMNVSSPVPIGSADFARKKGEALERLGGQMINVGEGLYKSEAATKATKAGVELQEFYQRARLDAAHTASADGSDIEQKFQEIVDKGVPAIREKYSGNVLANKSIEQFNEKSFTESQTALYAQKLNMASEYHTTGVKEFQLSQQNTIYNAPSTEKPAYLRAAIVQNNELLNTHVKNGVISPTNAMKLRNDFYAKLGDSLLDGYIQNKDNGKALALVGAMHEDTQLFNSFAPDEAQKMGFVTAQEAEQLSAKGEMYQVPLMTKKDKMKAALTPEEALIMSHLPEGKREQIKKTVEAKMQVDSVMRLGDLNARMESFDKFSAIGKGTVEDRDRMLKDINTIPTLTKEARARLSAKVVMNFSISEQIKQMTMTPVGKQGVLIEQMEKAADKAVLDLIKANPSLKGMEEDLAVKGVRLEARDKITKSIETMTDIAKKDPALFHQRVDPTAAQLYKASADAGLTPQGTQALKQYNDYILSRSKYMGVPQKILTENQIQDFQAGIKTQTSPGSLNDFMLAQADKFGDHFPRAMTELIASDKEYAPYAALTYANPNKTKPLIDAIRNKPLIDKEFADGGLFNDQKSAVEDTIKTSLLPMRRMFVEKMPDSSNLAMIQGMETAVELRAKHLMVQNNVDASTASKTAYKEIIEDQYHIVNQGKNSVLVPKNLGGNQLINRTNMIEGYMNVYSQPNNFRELNVGVPASESAAGVSEIDYYQKLAPLTRWVTNADQTGIRMVRVNEKTGDWGTVYDKFDKPVEKSFYDIHFRTPEKVKQKWTSGQGQLSGKIDGVTDEQFAGRGTSR